MASSLKVPILVVDDDHFLSDSLSRLLTSHGYDVTLAHSGSDAIEACSRKSPQLVILDLGLPDLDGVQVCRELRQNYSFPILMLTSRSDSLSKVMGFEVGADDYLTKPFDAHELLARLKAILRRSQIASPDVRQIQISEDCLLDQSSRSLLSSGEIIDLTETEYKILEYMLLNLGRALEKDQIFQHVWEFDIEFSSNSLEVFVYRLRTKLQSHRIPLSIKTMRGYGYRCERITVQD